MFSKNSEKTFPILAALLVVAFFFTSTSSFADTWTGYDYDNKTTILIEEGNLVREGFAIQFYDYRLDRYHTAKIIFVESVVDGTRIQIKDLDTKKERTFIMQPQ